MLWSNIFDKRNGYVLGLVSFPLKSIEKEWEAKGTLTIAFGWCNSYSLIFVIVYTMSEL